ncbi:MAG: hypothetical protein RBT36_11710, partial [Desulfobulbus sp.]|nr:hypothetical protein [Desulfobulbus sp.]
MRILLNFGAGKQVYLENTRIFRGSLEFVQGVLMIINYIASAHEVPQTHPKISPGETEMLK